LEKIISQLKKYFVGDKEKKFQYLFMVVAKEQLETFTKAIKTVIEVIYDQLY
jgi:hypothetical protein